jgi:hypothetical protein
MKEKEAEASAIKIELAKKKADEEATKVEKAKVVEAAIKAAAQVTKPAEVKPAEAPKVISEKPKAEETHTATVPVIVAINNLISAKPEL